MWVKEQPSSKNWIASYSKNTNGIHLGVYVGENGEFYCSITTSKQQFQMRREPGTHVISAYSTDFSANSRRCQDGMEFSNLFDLVAPKEFLDIDPDYQMLITEGVSSFLSEIRKYSNH